MAEFADLYNENRQLLGKTSLRGAPIAPGEYVLVVCCWVTDSQGRLLLTKRAPEKVSFPNYWENSGGAAQAGETSRQAIAREVREETGIRAGEAEFIFLDSARTEDTFYDFYMLLRDVPMEEVRLQRGETCDKRWATFRQVHEMIDQGLLAAPIEKQFLRQEPMLLEELEKLR